MHGEIKFSPWVIGIFNLKRTVADFFFPTLSERYEFYGGH